MKQGIKVLIVDDDARNRRILREILQDDFLLDEAENGIETLEKVYVFRPDIILLDIMMPGMDGLEVCRRLRADNELKHLKLILVSGKAQTEERLKGYACGADDYISKPFDIHEMLAKVQVFARLKAAEELEQLKTDFLNLITHETYTPLNAVIAITELLQSDSNLSEKSHSLLLEIRHASEAIHEKIRRVLLLGELRRNPPLQLHAVYGRDWINSVCSLLSLQAKQRSIALEIENEDDSVVTGQYDLLQNALRFILENAIRFSREGTRVKVRGAHSATEYTITVTDCGPGVDSQRISTLLEPFQIPQLLSNSHGLGISLALTGLILQLHQGTLTAANLPEGGAVFTLCLPLASAV